MNNLNKLILFRIIFIALLLILTMFFSYNMLYSSTIEYYDIVAEEGYVLDNSNLDDISFSFTGKDINYDLLSVEDMGNSNYNVNYKDDEISFSFLVEVLQDSGSSQIIPSQRHALTISDENVVLNSGQDIATCNVINSFQESIDINVYSSGESIGVHPGEVSCYSSVIELVSQVDVLNIDSEYKYSIDGSNALYAIDFHILEDEQLTSVSDKEIIERTKADTNANELFVSNYTQDYITLSDGINELQIDVIRDDAPTVELLPYYEVSSANDFDILNIISPKDDYTSEEELDITLNGDISSGINVLELIIEDEYGNLSTNDILVLVDDGSYIIGDNERYIFTKVNNNIILNGDKTTLEVFSIADMKYEQISFDANLVSVDNQVIELNDMDNGYIEYDDSNDSETNLPFVLMYLVFFVVLLLIVLYI